MPERDEPQPYVEYIFKIRIYDPGVVDYHQNGEEDNDMRDKINIGLFERFADVDWTDADEVKVVANPQGD